MINEKNSLPRLLLALSALVLMAGVVLMAYKPGIGGIFLLDDAANLKFLTEFNQQPGWGMAWESLQSGISGPLGRPLSVLSFLMDGSNWPSDPGAFRNTNLMLHIANGLLIFLLLFRLTLRYSGASVWPAFLVSTLWLLHPIHTATVLYIVQRMVLLSAFFALLGMWLYWVGRDMVAEGKQRQGVLLSALGLFLGIGCGVLAKENAVLMLVYLLVVESYWYSPAVRGPDRLRSLRLTIIGTLLALLVIYLAVRWPSFQEAYLARSFTLTERLLTEARVVVQYALATLAPRSGDIGIFHDDLVISKTIFDPISTLYSLVVLSFVIAIAWVSRSSGPIVTTAIFWFLGGHLLESTIIPLELRFDHRNYLPSIGLIGIIVYGFFVAIQRVDRKLMGFALLAFAVLLAAQTYNLSYLWGNPLLGAVIWPTEHPNSVRARQMASAYWMTQGNVEQAEVEIVEAAERNPNNALLLLSVAQLQCLNGKDPSYLLRKFQSWTPNILVYGAPLDALDRLRDLSSKGHCPNLPLSKIRELADHLLSAPGHLLSNNFRGYLWFIRAQSLVGEGRVMDAIDSLEESGRWEPDVQFRFWQVIWGYVRFIC